jgi:hypothetical protein
LAIFPLILRDIFSSHEYQLTDSDTIIIGQCNVKHIKTILSELKVSTYIVTTIPTLPTGLTANLVIMSFSSYKTTVIQYILIYVHLYFIYNIVDQKYLPFFSEDQVQVYNW